MFTDLPSVSHVLTSPSIQTSLMLKLRNVYHSALLSDITPTDAKKGQKEYSGSFHIVSVASAK